MNKVILTGKIIRENRQDKVTYTTIMCRTNNGYEYIPITIFNTDFYNKYFWVNKWISIEGYIHINKYNETYTTEIIAEKLSFVGDATEMDTVVNNYYKAGGTNLHDAS